MTFRLIKTIILCFILAISIQLSAQTDEIAINKTIRVGNLNIEVSNYNKAIFKIDSIVTKLNGYIAEEKEANFKTKISNQVIIRIPNQHFSKVVYEITQIANNVNTKDITVIKVNKAIADLTQRLNSKQEIKNRYMDLIAKSKIAIEISDLEAKIAVVSNEIEMIQKEISNYNEIDISTLNVYLVQQAEIMGNPNTGGSADLSKNSMMQFFRNILIYSIVPVVLLLFYYFVVYRRMERAKRKKRREKSGHQSPW